MFESANNQLQGFGCFRFAKLNLAVHIAALREVVPFEGLVDIPSKAQFIEGAISLRGVLIPVLNLCKVLGKPHHPDENQCVVIVRHEGKVLGLLTSEIQGLHYLAAEQISPVYKSTDSDHLIEATLMPSKGPTCSLLSVSALFKLEGWLAAQDHEISFKDSIHKGQPHTLGKTSQSLLLIKAGNRELGVSPNDIEASISHPEIKKNELSTSVFLGTFDYRGAQVPAVRLTALMGFKPSVSESIQIVVIRVNTGPIGLVIDEVVELIQVSQDQFSSVPAFGFSKPDWVQAILPNECLPPDVLEKTKPQGNYQIILNIDTLRQAQELCGLAKTYQTSAIESDPNTKKAALSNSKLDNRVVIFETDRELCVQVKTISEILKFDPAIEDTLTDPEVVGVITNRGRSIPVFDTGYLIDQIATPFNDQSAVLLVQVEQAYVGFAVHRLVSIETVDWENVSPSLAASRVQQFDTSKRKKIVEVETGQGKRVLECIDLYDLAQLKLQPAPA